MFNIKSKIYVAHDQEQVDLMYERCLVLHSHWTPASEFNDMEEDKTQKGILATFGTYEDMINLKFNGSVKEFHEFLNQEEDLLIIVSKNDYARLYAEMQLELANDFGITEVNLELMRDLQRLKDFFLGTMEMRKFCYAQRTGDSVFDRVFKKAKDEYKPSGILFRNISQLPFEVIFALYKWGNISKVQATNKVVTVAKSMLISEIDIILESGRIALTHSPDILIEYTDKDLQTTDDVMKAIFSDPLLTKLFSADFTDVNFENAEEVEAVKKLCNIIIENYSKLELQPEVDHEELDFFFKLFETQDIDVVEKARVNLVNTGMMATRQGKFNTGLIMAV